LIVQLRMISSPALTPHTPQLGVKTETRFIFKDYDLITGAVSNRLKFFLTPFGSFLPLSARPARTCKGVALAHIQIHAVRFGHDVPESSPGESVSDTPPPPRHPSAFDSDVFGRLAKGAFQGALARSAQSRGPSRARLIFNHGRSFSIGMANPFHHAPLG
jgi:hypothetical protein